MRFEYKVITLKASIWGGKSDVRDNAFQSALNSHGAVGWDLVSVTPYGATVQAFMKREK